MHPVWSNVVKISSNLKLLRYAHGRDTFDILWFIFNDIHDVFNEIHLLIFIFSGSTFVVSLSVKHVINLVYGLTIIIMTLWFVSGVGKSLFIGSISNAKCLNYI